MGRGRRPGDSSVRHWRRRGPLGKWRGQQPQPGRRRRRGDVSERRVIGSRERGRLLRVSNAGGCGTYICQQPCVASYYCFAVITASMLLCKPLMLQAFKP